MDASVKLRVTPKDFFLWLGAMVALYISTTGTVWVVRPFPTGFTILANGYSVMQWGTQTAPYNDPNWTADAAGYIFAADAVGSAGSLSTSGAKVALTSSQLALMNSSR